MRNLLFQLTLCATMAVALAAPSQAQEGHHGVGHAANHNWYKGLMQPGTRTSCCNDNDCRPTKARYNPTTQNWEAIKDGRWISIPPSKIIDADIPAEAGAEAHLCAPASSFSYPPDAVFCFIRPNGGT